jgi:hypothetical protein
MIDIKIKSPPLPIRYFIIIFISLSLMSQVIFMRVFKFLTRRVDDFFAPSNEVVARVALIGDEPVRELQERQRRTAQAATHNPGFRRLRVRSVSRESYMSSFRVASLAPGGSMEAR